MDVAGVSVPLWLLVGLLLLTLLYRFSTNTYGTFREMGIPGPRPWPLVGNMHSVIWKGLYYFDHKFVKEYGKLVGFYRGQTPVLLVSDPEIVKQVMVKDFSTFRNRDRLPVKIFPLDRMMVTLRDDHWKHVRDHVSPNFSGHKLKRMMTHINAAGRTLVANLNVVAKAGDAFEAKRHTASYTMDVIASTSFSIDVDSQNDKDSRIITMAQRIFDINRRLISGLMLIVFPGLTRRLVGLGLLELFTRDALQFFVDLTNKAIQYREEHPDENPKDFLEMILSSRVSEQEEERVATGDGEDVVEGTSGTWTKAGLTRGDILGQCLIFFFAGYDTTSSVLSFTLYCLAVNPECQERAYQEIQDVIGQADPQYDDVKRLTYVTMCIEEAMRLYPIAVITNRQASEDTSLCGVSVRRGMSVSIPIYALHHDPEVWPEPHRYDPQRFSPDAVSARHEFQYLPFGAGPRGCVAKRLALLEVKVALVHILRKYRMVTCERTQIPLKLKHFKVEAQKGIWLKAEARD